MKKIFQKAFLFVATMTFILWVSLVCSDDDRPVTEGNVVPARQNYQQLPTLM